MTKADLEERVEALEKELEFSHSVCARLGTEWRAMNEVVETLRKALDQLTLEVK